MTVKTAAEVPSDVPKRCSLVHYGMSLSKCICIESNSDVRGQPTIYFAIGDHANVSWCRSHTNASGVMAT